MALTSVGVADDVVGQVVPAAPIHPVAVHTVGGAEYQAIKLVLGDAATADPISKGQQLMANSVPVAFATDQSPLPFTGTITGTATVDQTTVEATVPAMGAIAGASITGTYATLISVTGAVKILSIFNSTNKPIFVSLDTGATNHIKLDGQSLIWDLKGNGIKLTNPVIQVKHDGVAPTTGLISATVTL